MKLLLKRLRDRHVSHMPHRVYLFPSRKTMSTLGVCQVTEDFFATG
jgi:hypothetical protein